MKGSRVAADRSATVGGCLLPALFASALVACAGARPRVVAIDDMDRAGVEAGPEQVQLAPEAYARARQERDLARAAHASGDDVAAELHAQRAIAAVAHARAVARVARASAELVDAQKSFADATAEETSLEASRTRLESDATELEQRIRVARQRLIPAASAPATPEREAARAAAARSLAMQARLLCGAARLVASDAPGLADAESEVAALRERLTKRSQLAPIDEGAASRAHCLDVLTRARRAAGYDAGTADALLAELSAAGGWDPSRDERGVAVTLHDAFRGTELTPAAQAKLAELGRVAAAHALFAVQLVVHDARVPAPDDATDGKRADSAAQAILRGGAAAARVRAELAGALVPVVDSSDTKARVRNERLEIVFVGGVR